MILVIKMLKYDIWKNDIILLILLIYLKNDIMILIIFLKFLVKVNILGIKGIWIRMIFF